MVKDKGEADLEALEQQMRAAADAMDFETAAFLRNEIARLKGEAPLISKPVLGHMGLGTDRPIQAKPEGWVKPKKPDPMTSGRKKR
jgi:hypothetical protein